MKERELDRVGFLMRYFMDWWTQLQVDNAKDSPHYPNKYETVDGTLIFPVEYVRRQFNDSETDTRSKAAFFTPKEVKEMPKLKDGKHRITKDGLHQIRYRREGYDKQFTAKDLKTVKEMFREWIKSLDTGKKAIAPKRSQNFEDFSARYFENVKRINVSESTYTSQLNCLKRHVFPALGKTPVKNITPLLCQALLNEILDKGKGRTAEQIKTLLSELFRNAVGERLIPSNPMQYVKIPKHLKTHGRALSPQEIEKFIADCEKSYYRKQFMLFLYTGIRRNELHSATFDDNFVTVACGKCRKGERQQYRKIPIAPNLRKYLPLGEKELASCNKVLSREFKKLCQDHHLHDLRHTFTTRAQESGIAKSVVDVWTGHVNRSDMTSAVYTSFSDAFLLEEIKKLDY